jgi:CBS domain-containing protein
MFQVYGLQGRVFSGTLEEWRRLPPVSPVSRTRRVERVSESAADDPGGPAWDGRTSDGRLAVAAYGAVSRPQQRRALMVVADVMRRPAQVVRASATVAEAWQQLARLGIGQAPVVDAAGTLVGLVGRAELLPLARLEQAAADPRAWQALLAQPVSDVMWTPVTGALPDTDLRRIAALLLESGLPGLPVTAGDGSVIGFISRTDLLRAVTADPPLDLWG